MDFAFLCPPSYPPNDEKVALARSIINTFPSLKVQIDGEGDGFVNNI